MDSQYASFVQLCEQRRSVRDFQDRPVPAAAIARIQRIAATAPYASGRKNWRLAIVDDRAQIDALGSLAAVAADTLAASLRSDFAGHFKDYARSFTKFVNAPLLVIPVFRFFPTVSTMQSEPSVAITRWEEENYLKSIACVAMLVQLAAEAQGLGSCIMTGPLLAEAAMARQLGLRASYRIGAVIPVGYPRKECTP